MKEYAMYRGDKFIDLGTAKELAERHGVTERTIKYYAQSNRWKNENKGNRLEVIPLDEEEE